MDSSRSTSGQGHFLLHTTERRNLRCCSKTRSRIDVRSIYIVSVLSIHQCSLCVIYMKLYNHVFAYHLECILQLTIQVPVLLGLSSASFTLYIRTTYGGTIRSTSASCSDLPLCETVNVTTCATDGQRRYYKVQFAYKTCPVNNENCKVGLLSCHQSP